MLASPSTVVLQTLYHTNSNLFVLKNVNGLKYLLFNRVPTLFFCFVLVGVFFFFFFLVFRGVEGTLSVRFGCGTSVAHASASVNGRPIRMDKTQRMANENGGYSWESQSKWSNQRFENKTPSTWSKLDVVCCCTGTECSCLSSTPSAGVK